VLFSFGVTYVRLRVLRYWWMKTQGGCFFLFWMWGNATAIYLSEIEYADLGISLSIILS
jgi:hypothetical protein